MGLDANHDLIHARPSPSEWNQRSLITYAFSVIRVGKVSHPSSRGLSWEVS